jgi:hypothetical protein
LTASMKTSNSSATPYSDSEITKDEARHTKASKRTPDRLPKGEQKANSRERLLASAERTRIFVSRTLSPDLVVRLHLKRQGSCIMVEQNFPIITTVRKMETEDEFASECDVATELLPSL